MHSKHNSVVVPVRSLVQLQDSYVSEHLPEKMREHIEDQLQALDSQRGAMMKTFSNRGSEFGSSIPFIMGLPSPRDGSTF